MKWSLVLIAALVCMIGCVNEKDRERSPLIEDLENVDEEDVFFDYRITANEGDDNLTIFLRYTLGEDGETLVIDSPAKVELDGVELKVDSAGRTGAYYEVQRPIAGFNGSHTITFTSYENTYREEFEFQPLRILSGILDTISRDSLVLELDGLMSSGQGAEDYIRVILLDTSVHRDGINRLDTLSNGRLVIGRSEMAQLAAGPIHLELHREFERPVQKGTAAGGRVYLTYSLKRDFYLKN